MTSDKYVVNFLRDRDSYHVPAALHRHGRLEKLVTDIYFERLPPRFRGPLQRLQDHRSARLPPSHVENSLVPAVIQTLGAVTRSKADWIFHADRALARRTAAIWRAKRSGILAYSGYALEPFRAALGTSAARLLFLFHPHHSLVGDLLEADASRFPEVERAFAADIEIRATWRHTVYDEELKHAQGVVSASTFSATSARRAGYEGPIEVVPYFSETASNPAAAESREEAKCHFLFVGQGVQRKGLHHLLRAWRESPPPNSTLTCVCSVLDEHIRALATPDVQFKRGLSRGELIAEFDRAHCFVMPSLVEGFGLVYLEALSRGAFVIATENTGFPDMDVPESCGLTVPVGEVGMLATQLNAVAARARANELDHKSIADFCQRYGFEQYAQRLVAACDELSLARQQEIRGVKR